MTDVRDMKLPFGKYKGVSLHRVPIGYLRWLLKVADEQFQRDHTMGPAGRFAGIIDFELYRRDLYTKWRAERAGKKT